MEHETNQELEPEIVSIKPSRRGKSKKRHFSDREYADILTRIAKGQTQTEIAKVKGVSSEVISKIRQAYLPVFNEISKVEDYRLIKQDIIEANEYKLLKSVNKLADDPSTKLRDAAFSFKVVHEAGRLERGLSTRNTEAHHTYTRVSLD